MATFISQIFLLKYKLQRGETDISLLNTTHFKKIELKMLISCRHFFPMQAEDETLT